MPGFLAGALLTHHHELTVTRGSKVERAITGDLSTITYESKEKVITSDISTDQSAFTSVSSRTIHMMALCGKREVESHAGG